MSNEIIILGLYAVGPKNRDCDISIVYITKQDNGKVQVGEINY